MLEGEVKLNLEDELERCRPWLEAALEYSGGTHVFDDIVVGVRTGEMQLWPTPRGCILTELTCYPRKKVINVFLGGGELDQIMDMQSDLIKWAKSQGCSALTMTGRKGWIKPLLKAGWINPHYVYEKEFE